MSELIIEKLLTAANRYDTEGFLSLFTTDALIDDISVGEAFKGTAGIRKYFTSYFIGYHTRTAMLSSEQSNDGELQIKVDFTGDFGRETGGLNIRLNAAGLIIHIDAYLDQQIQMLKKIP